MLWFLLIVYILSAVITGAIHWATYHDDKGRGRDISMEDKVMKLYIVPLCPGVNTLTAFGIIFGYFT